MTTTPPAARTTRSIWPTKAGTSRSSPAPTSSSTATQPVHGRRRAGEPGRGRRPARPARRRSEPQLRAAARAVAERLRAPHARQVRLRLPGHRRAGGRARVPRRACRSTRPPATSRRSTAYGDERGTPSRRTSSYRCQLSFPVIDPTRSRTTSLPGQAERRRAPRAGRRAGRRPRVRLRLVRELRVRRRDAAHGHQRAVTTERMRRAGRSATPRAAARAPSGPPGGRRARTRRA